MNTFRVDQIRILVKNIDRLYMAASEHKPEQIYRHKRTSDRLMAPCSRWGSRCSFGLGVLPKAGLEA